MTFQDIFRSDFLENMASISLLDMVLALSLSFLLGLFLFLVYKKTYAGITTVLIMTVVSNVVLSLGMVGALSIVRFRTAIKEPMDIAFLFWSIAVGIVLAAGLIPLAVFGSLLIGLVLILFSAGKNVDHPYILVIHCENGDQEKEIRTFVEASVKRMSLKSKSVSPGRIELNYEIRLRKESSEFVNELDRLPGVSQAVLVSYNGDYMG